METFQSTYLAEFQRVFIPFGLNVCVCEWKENGSRRGMQSEEWTPIGYIKIYDGIEISANSHNVLQCENKRFHKRKQKKQPKSTSASTGNHDDDEYYNDGCGVNESCKRWTAIQPFEQRNIMN